MNANIQTIQDTLPTVPKQTSAQEIVSLMNQYGGVRIKNYLTQEQVANINREVDAPLERLREGSSHDNELIKEFHGTYTKRLTNMVTHSKTFGDVLDDELFHELGEVLYREESGDWWLSTAQVIDIGPGNTAQMLHRDVGNFPPLRARRQRADGIHQPHDCADALHRGKRRHPNHSGEPELGRGLLRQQGHARHDHCRRDGCRRRIAVQRQGDPRRRRERDEERAPARAHDSDATVLPDAGGSVSLHRRDGHREAPVETRSTNHRLPLAYPAGTPGLWQVDYDDIATHLGL